MKIVLCSDREWLLSEEAYRLYAPHLRCTLSCTSLLDNPAAYAAWKACMYQPAYDDFKIQMEELLNDQSVRVFVCENRGKKTGMMVLKDSDSVAEIIGIAVPENLRRQGIGRHLIQFVMESEGVKWIEAQTDDDSVGFYRKCGFDVKRIIVDYPDGSAVRYSCILNK